MVIKLNLLKLIDQIDNGVTITVEDSDFISMLTGKANAQQLVCPDQEFLFNLI